MYMRIENIKMGLVKIVPLNNYSIKDIIKTSEFYTRAGYEVSLETNR